MAFSVPPALLAGGMEMTGSAKKNQQKAE